eukprot:g29520.t1
MICITLTLLLYGRLYNNLKHTGSATSQPFLYTIREVSDNSSWENLDQPLSQDGLTKALEYSEKNKTPRSNCLLVELYSALWDLIGQALLEVYDSILLAGRTFSENLVLLGDTITNVQDKGLDTCLISLDQEKAFDRILHTSIWDALFKMGFGE